MARKLPFVERNLRRARVYGGRALRSAGLPATRHPTFFMHMPKCGGTSIAEAMYATVPLGRGLAVIDSVASRRAAAIRNFGRDDPLLCHEDLEHGDKVFDLRETLLLQHMAWGSWLIHGHVLFSVRAAAHFGGYRYVTLLRDPVTRMISNYRMLLQRGGIAGGLDGYLDGPVARSHAQVYLRYLSGQTVIADADQPLLIESAKNRLSGFAVTGFLDDLPAFQRRYREVLGVSLRIGTYNRARGERPDVTPTQLARIEALCAPDQAIYDFARARR